MNIFISFHPEEARFVKSLEEEFERFGISLISHNLYKRNKFDHIRKLDDAVPGVDFIIAVLSKKYVIDDWIKSNELWLLKGKEDSLKRQVIYPVLRDDCKIPKIISNKRKLFKENSQKKDQVKEITDFFLKMRKVFIVMAFNDSQLNSAYANSIKPLLEEFKYAPVRIDEFTNSGKISQQILDEIRNSEIVLVELFGERPNCYYEAGFAEGLGKTVIFTDKGGQDVHFDLKDNRYISWNTELELKTTLKHWLEDINKKSLDNSFKF